MSIFGKVSVFNGPTLRYIYYMRSQFRWVMGHGYNNGIEILAYGTKDSACPWMDGELNNSILER